MNATNSKLVVKKVAGSTGMQIFKDGQKVGVIRFHRGRDSQGVVHAGGRIVLTSGREISLDGYSYFADVRRDLNHLIGE